jgi:U3 small nucleolar RNA-associated protein 25
VRQTLLFSGFLFPELNALFNRLHNYSGKAKMVQPAEGNIAKVVLQVPQVFHRISCKTPADMDDAKFLYFKEKLLPDLRDPLLSKHTCVFFSSYFEYLRVRNYLRELEVEFANICEYSTNSSITRARTAFFHGQQHIMLVTERFHFFRRPRIRGIRHLIFYGLPENQQFYPEMLNLLQGENTTCACLFSKYDRFKLERIVGTERCARMISSDQPTFMFV